MPLINLNAGSIPVNYDVYVENGIIDRAGRLIQSLSPSLVVLISNDNVMGFHGDRIKSSFEATDLPFVEVVIPDGEIHKNLDTIRFVYEKMLEAGADRKSVVVPFGGGVTGDAGGFAAATYMRGVRYVHVPTSLVAQVDSSIGGKVGVDLPGGKNLAGAFYHPQMVITDPELLRTLPPEEFANGMAEVIKSAIIGSRKLFEICASVSADMEQISSSVLEEIVLSTAKIKVDIVSRDANEKGERMKLNLGHTVGHGAEYALGFKGISHGSAVAAGMVTACRIAEKLGVLEDTALTEDLKKVLKKFNLPLDFKGIDPDDIMLSMLRDKKNFSGISRFILPRRRGFVEIVSNPDNEIIKQAVYNACTKLEDQ